MASPELSPLPAAMASCTRPTVRPASQMARVVDSVEGVRNVHVVYSESYHAAVFDKPRSLRDASEFCAQIGGRDNRAFRFCDRNALAWQEDARRMQEQETKTRRRDQLLLRQGLRVKGDASKRVEKIQLQRAAELAQLQSQKDSLSKQLWEEEKAISSAVDRIEGKIDNIDENLAAIQKNFSEVRDGMAGLTESLRIATAARRSHTRP